MCVRGCFVLKNYLESHGKKHGGLKGWRIQRWDNSKPNQVQGRRILRYNGQDLIVRSGNFLCSSIRVASINENKTQPSKMNIIHSQTTCPNHIALRTVKKWLILPWLEPWPHFFLKSITEFKLKEKLLKCKSTIQITTFNVKTLNRIDLLPELTASAIDHNIDRIFLQIYIYHHSDG